MNWRPEKPRTRNENHSWAKWRLGCSISRTVLYFVNNCVSCPFSYGHCIRLYIMISGYSFDISSSKSPKLVNYIFLFYSASSFKHTTYKTRRTYMSICFLSVLNQCSLMVYQLLSRCMKSEVSCMILLIIVFMK